MWYFDAQEKMLAEERVEHSAATVEKERKRIENEIQRFENKHQSKAIVSKEIGPSAAPSVPPSLPAPTCGVLEQVTHTLDEVDLDALD